jgi:hypothetical protein
MNVVKLRSDLHHLIDTVNDVSILSAIKTILSKQKSKTLDWADDLSDNLREELEASISEADKRKVINHEEAMNQIKSRYNF